MSKDKKKVTTFSLSEKVIEAIKTRAESEDRSASWIVNKILTKELQA